ncbi:hypothetical protein E2R51_02415 [Jeotgalibacillus sp. S-D1]|uniref:hypothetical protein n=1 Tax=Jeotgalibacillus sp. S-D1 TaxID=2552189 RepID=UPI00105A0748|nr:hypothetical protein [Jeotgalibacillus sp. S-D1]TDL34591.1 hypothetical protein E2R51_02415 [Jeotgalibacillus sp. S-D1]
MYSDQELLSSINKQIPFLLKRYPQFKSVIPYKREMSATKYRYGYEIQDEKRLLYIYKEFLKTSEEFKPNSMYDVYSNGAMVQGSKTFDQAYEYTRAWP